MKALLIRCALVVLALVTMTGAVASVAQASGNGGTACERTSDRGIQHIKHCAPYTVRVEAIAGVDPVSGTLTVECRRGFVRGVTSFGALTTDSLVAVTRTVATPSSYTVDYTMWNTTSGGMYLQTECLRAA
jgi:hypothetical protein